MPYTSSGPFKVAHGQGTGGGASASAGQPRSGNGGASANQPGTSGPLPFPQPSAQSKRFHGTVSLDPTGVGRDASRIAEEVISHLEGLVGSKVKVTMEIDAEIPSGTPDNVVRTVSENSRTLKFISQGFEKE
jgi:hypothetical protein